MICTALNFDCVRTIEMLPALGKVAVVFVIDSDSALKENKYKIGVTELVDIALLC